MNDEAKVIATIKRVMPAVVSIVISKHLEDVGQDVPPEMYPYLPKGPKGPRLEIPETMINKRGMVEVGGGSGFIVAPNGLILTNKHVITDGKAEYTVITNDGRKFATEILSRDPVNDIAILKIEATNLPVVTLGDATKIELGKNVIAIGNALGIFKNTVSLGIVSGLSRSLATQTSSDIPVQEMRGLIQTDAAINVGNSGGPLVDMDGRAIGVNAAIISGAQSIGFAIPINAAERDLDDLKRYGRIRRPLLGVRYIIIDENFKDKMNLPVSYGALIIKETAHDHSVAPGSPAEKAGLKEKDIVLEIESRKITREYSIQDALEDRNVSDVIVLKVLRNNKEVLLKAKLEERK